MSDATEPKAAAVETPVVLPEPMTEPKAETPAPPVAATRKGGFGAFSGMVLGGLVAGGLGYAAGQAWPLVQPTGAELTALQAEVAALKSATAPADPRIDDLTARLDALDAAPKADSAALEARLDGIEAALAAAPAPDAAIKALQDEVARLKLAPAGAIDTTALKAEADKILATARAEAEATAAASRSAAAVDRLQAAMDSGAPFGASLADLTDPPAELAELAATGVPSLTSLRDSFPDAARAALAAAIQADMGDSWTERALSFLQSTTGARSTTPRDGNDPDAILSRAEAAVAAGDLATALGEIAALPAVAQEVLAPWVAKAKTRQDALAALADLTARIGG
jgi:hypothetical protein